MRIASMNISMILLLDQALIYRFLKFRGQKQGRQQLVLVKVRDLKEFKRKHLKLLLAQEVMMSVSILARRLNKEER
jgi:hypothetical protein